MGGRQPRPRLLVAVGLVDRADAGDDRLLRALVQALAPALDRGEELVEVDLERRENRVGPVFHLEPGLTRLTAGFLDYFNRLVLGQLDDLGLRSLHYGLLARLAENAIRLAVGLCEHVLTLLDDPASPFQLLRDRCAHLIEDVVDLFAIDAYLVGEGHLLGVVN